MKPGRWGGCIYSQNRFFRAMKLSWRGLQSDESLAASCLAGEVEAFDELVRRHRDRLFNLCYRLCGDREFATDLAQQALVRAYQRLNHYDTDRPFAPWLNQLTVNVCLNAIRDRRRELDQESSRANWELRTSSVELSPVRQVLDGEVEVRLQEAILELPPRYRAVAVLRYLEDQSYEEIADTLNLPLGTVKTQLFRAREQLREQLREFLTGS